MAPADRAQWDEFMLEQFRISDFVDWRDNKTLHINRDYQRGSVWSSGAKIFLIDTILRGYPIPKIYMRTIIDRENRRTVREVVDGQQRLRAIFDFVDDKIVLSSRAKEFSGLRFSRLDPEDQDKFLQYPIAVDQLINATDTLVLDIFARLNSYNVRLNPAELRHAEFQGDFKWSCHEMALKYSDNFKDLGIFSSSNLVRMQSDSLVAEMYGIILDGITDGGQPNIGKIYKQHDSSENFNREDVEAKFEQTLDWILENISEDLSDTAILRPTHYLLLFAAVAHSLVGIPAGRLQGDEFRAATPLLNRDDIVENLALLSEIIELEEEPDDLGEFWLASRSSTQRISSRRVRFVYYLDAVSES